MIDWFGIMVAGEDRDAADVDAESRAEIGEWDVRRSGGVRWSGSRSSSRRRRWRRPRRRCCRWGRMGRSRVHRPDPIEPAVFSLPPEPPPPPIDAGPTDVHAWLDSAAVWLSVKIRKLDVGLVATWFARVPWSAPASGN